MLYYAAVGFDVVTYNTVRSRQRLSYAVRALEEVRRLKQCIDAARLNLRVIGVGGVSSAADVQDRLDVAAHHVHIATAAMLYPLLACRIRKTQLRRRMNTLSRSRSL